MRHYLSEVTLLLVFLPAEVKQAKLLKAAAEEAAAEEAEAGEGAGEGADPAPDLAAAGEGGVAAFRRST